MLKLIHTMNHTIKMIPDGVKEHTLIQSPEQFSTAMFLNLANHQIRSI